MSSVTFLSIMRNSSAYILRYIRQIEQARELFDSLRVVVVEGDHEDDTRAILEHWSKTAEYRVDPIAFDHGGPKYGSVVDMNRWAQLERCWNRAMDALEPCDYVIAVESDLIWSVAVLRQCLDGLCTYDVVAPMLMLGSTFTFYDTNGFRLPDGRKFRNLAPYIPDWDGRHYVELATAGGLIVTTYERAKDARWRDECRLHFAPDARYAVDTRIEIRHP